jgi:hypothetical protein
MGQVKSKESVTSNNLNNNISKKNQSFLDKNISETTINWNDVNTEDVSMTNKYVTKIVGAKELVGKLDNLNQTNAQNNLQIIYTVMIH